MDPPGKDELDSYSSQRPPQRWRTIDQPHPKADESSLLDDTGPNQPSGVHCSAGLTLRWKAAEDGVADVVGPLDQNLGWLPSTDHLHRRIDLASVVTNHHEQSRWQRIPLSATQASVAPSNAASYEATNLISNLITSLPAKHRRRRSWKGRRSLCTATKPRRIHLPRRRYHSWSFNCLRNHGVGLFTLLVATSRVRCGWTLGMQPEFRKSTPNSRQLSPQLLNLLAKVPNLLLEAPDLGGAHARILNRGFGSKADWQPARLAAHCAMAHLRVMKNSTTV